MIAFLFPINHLSIIKHFIADENDKKPYPELPGSIEQFYCAGAEQRVEVIGR
jgi:hypothetical protein